MILGHVHKKSTNWDIEKNSEKTNFNVFYHFLPRFELYLLPIIVIPKYTH